MPDQPIAYTIADGSRIVEVDKLPEVDNGFIWFNGVLREVSAIHTTRGGKQIELMP